MLNILEGFGILGVITLIIIAGYGLLRVATWAIHKWLIK